MRRRSRQTRKLPLDLGWRCARLTNSDDVAGSHAPEANIRAVSASQKSRSSDGALRPLMPW